MHSISGSSGRGAGGCRQHRVSPTERPSKDRQRAVTGVLALSCTNQSVHGTFYFYKTITKYSKIQFSKLTAVISQFINAKTSFVYLCTNYRPHRCGLITMCAFKKYYFLINSLKLKITEFFQFVQK